MNITGHSQYSKQVVGIKDPTKFTNQQQKLIFIYPMLFADKIKVPNAQAFETTMRDFISVTFLSDLFIQNTFNVVGMANQIRPLWDENRQTVDPTTALVKSLQQQGVYTSGPVTPNYPVGPEHTQALQYKINQKTAVIQQLVKSDPKMAKTRPFIEVITLGNMIEVPVIVGTAQYPVDTLTLMYTLIAAIGLNRKLNNEQDLDVIFHELETLDEKKYWNLLNNLTRTKQETGDLADWFRERAFSGMRAISGSHAIRSNVPTIARAAGNLASRLQKRIENPPELNPQHELLAPLLLNKQDIDQTKLYFKFVLNPKFAKTQFGIDASNEDSRLSDLSQAKLQGELYKIHEVTMSAYAKLIGTLGNSLILSISNLVSTTDSTVDIMSEKLENIDKNMLAGIDTQLNEILIGIDNGLKGSSAQESKIKIDILKDLCKINSSEDLNDYMDQAVSMDVSVVSGDFDLSKFKTFVSFFNDFANVSSSMASKMENEIKYLSSDQEQASMAVRFDTLQKTINSSIVKLFKPFMDDLSDPNSDSRLSQVSQATNNDIRTRTIPKFASGLSQIFYFVLLSQLQASLCKFILVADIDIETASNEVTSWPNYTLTLPVEIVLALHAAIMGTSWKHMLSGGQIGKELTDKNTQLTKDQVSKASMFNANESYIKGIVKFICQRLDVPNLIVVDSKKGDIYYKLMNQTSVNKTKITTIETFIQSKLNRQMVSQF